MPKRSNQFQKLVAFFAEQVAPIGATVRESVELFEKGLDGAVPREVDVLIEIDTGIAPIRVAIECRDRSRKDDIQWIDDLIGKYQNLQVNQVIAVSNSGFSESARKKAELNKIVTLSLEEAKEIDWPEKFTKLGVALIEQHWSMLSITLTADPPLKDNIDANDKLIIIETPDSNSIQPELITLQEVIQATEQGAVKQAQEYLSVNFLSVYKNLADLGKDAHVVTNIPISGLALMSGGTRYEIRTINYKLLVRTSHSTVNVKQYLLTEKAMVTSAILPAEDDHDAEISLVAVQIADKPEGRLFLESRKKKQRRKAK